MVTSCQIFIGSFIGFYLFSSDILHSIIGIVMLLLVILFLTFSLILVNNDHILSDNYNNLYGVLYDDLI